MFVLSPDGRRRVHQPWRWLPFPVRLGIARLRRWSIRHRFVRRAVLVALVFITLSLLIGLRSRAVAVREAWGPTTRVVMVGASHPAGALLEPGDFVLVALPKSLVADDALHEAPTSVETTVRTLLPGDVVTTRDLRSMRPALDLPADHRAVSLPVDATFPTLDEGDLVDVYIVSDPLGGFDVAARLLGTPSIVVDVSEEAVVLGVPASNVEDIVRGTTAGRVTVVLR